MLDPVQLKRYFYLSQMGLGVLFVLGILYVRRSRDSGSSFRVREADRIPPKPKSPVPINSAPNFKGLPHEILGVDPTASEDEVMEAYRNLMKIYHPDRIAAQGSIRWQEAQLKAKQINIAKDQMLKNKPSRSGR